MATLCALRHCPATTNRGRPVLAVFGIPGPWAGRMGKSISGGGLAFTNQSSRYLESTTKSVAHRCWKLRTKWRTLVIHSSGAILLLLLWYGTWRNPEQIYSSAGYTLIVSLPFFFFSFYSAELGRMLPIIRQSDDTLPYPLHRPALCHSDWTKN